jgi:glycosyltransferase 2 family protein
LNRSRALLLLAVKLTASAVLLWIILRQVESHEVLARMKQLDVGYAAGAFIPQLVSIAIMALRWQVLARELISYGQAFTYTWIGLFYGSLLPGGVSGDVAKGAALALKDKSSRSVILPVSILIDRVVGLYALLLLFCGACAWLALRSGGADHALDEVGLIGFLGGLAGAVVMPLLFTAAGLRWFQRLTARIGSARLNGVSTQIAQAADLYRKAPGPLWKALALSGGVHVTNILYNHYLLRALDIDLPAGALVGYYALMSVLVMIPISISGIGVREWLILLYFPAFGVSGEAGVAFAWTCLAAQWVIATFGGGFQLFEFFRSNRFPVSPP